MSSNSCLNESLKNKLSRVCKDFHDTVLIENVFQETTRDGKDILRSVRLALTTNALVLTAQEDQSSTSQTSFGLNDGSSQELLALYPWASVKLFIFKRSKRQCVKAVFSNNHTRYFELQKLPKVKIYWGLWCNYIKELNNSKKTWPFALQYENKPKFFNQQFCGTHHVEIYILKSNESEYVRPIWTDKSIYLGSIREVEDKIRPRPMPGLGKTEDIKLLYLKPRYFGCWEQSEHWVQCGGSSHELAFQDNK